MSRLTIEVKRPALGPIIASQVVIELRISQVDEAESRFTALMENLSLLKELWELRCNTGPALEGLAKRIRGVIEKGKEIDSIYYQLEGPSRSDISEIGRKRFLEKAKGLEKELTKD